MIDKIIKTQDLHDDYVVSSNKIYIIGSQDGTFRKLGFHVPGEMGGIIAQPIKMADGYSLEIDGKQLIGKKYTFDNGDSVFSYEEAFGTLERREIAVPNEKAIVIKLSPNFKEAKTLTVTMDFHIMGCWTAEDCGHINDATILASANEKQVIVKSEIHPNYVGLFSNLCFEQAFRAEGDHLLATLTFENITNEEIQFLMISNNESEEALVVKHQELFSRLNILLEDKNEKLNKMFGKSELKTNDKAFDDAFNALKINYDMLIQNIDGIGEGYTAGFPDYPWFFGCDTTYGINGTLAVGQHKMTLQSLRLLKQISHECNDGNGRVMHEISPFGYVYNKGNLQETPQFITAVYEAYTWTGDRAFLEEMYDFCKKGMKWVESKAIDGIICPKGAGIIEINGVDGRLIDIAIWTYKAYETLEKMATIFGEEDLATTYKQKAEAQAKEIVEKFYSKEERFFADIICTKDEIMASKDLLINSVKNTKTQHEALKVYFDKLLEKECEQDELIPVVLKNWITVLPYTEHFLTEEMLEEGLEEMKKPNFYNASGMKLGCMCDDANDPSDDLYSINKSMSINTGYMAEVFARNKDANRGYALLKKLTDCAALGMPTAISEILPNDNQGCFMQFWSGYGIHHVFVRYILGIEVDAPNKNITIKPNLPESLTDITLNNLLVGECHYNITYKVREGKVTVRVEKDRADYTFEIQ